MKSGVKLLVHSQTPTVQPLKFGNERIITPYTLLGIQLLIHAGVKVNPWLGNRTPGFLESDQENSW